MGNAWCNMTPDDYDAHMSHPDVAQTQMLGRITKEQFELVSRELRPTSHIAILGITNGNGLEHIIPCGIENVIGIDINKAFLAECTSIRSQTPRWNRNNTAPRRIKFDIAENCLAKAVLFSFWGGLCLIYYPNCSICRLITVEFDHALPEDKRDAFFTVCPFHFAHKQKARCRELLIMNYPLKTAGSNRRRQRHKIPLPIKVTNKP